jgi:hypothetical protein
MLLPKGGVTWKSARARLPPWRAIIVLLTRTRFLISLAITGLVILLWRGISSSAAEMQKYVNGQWVFKACVPWIKSANSAVASTVSTAMARRNRP